ncbi:hypothetical protein ACMFMG_005390 [Clarireedia jacksonii]
MSCNRCIGNTNSLSSTDTAGYNLWSPLPETSAAPRESICEVKPASTDCIPDLKPVEDSIEHSLKYRDGTPGRRFIAL